MSGLRPASRWDPLWMLAPTLLLLAVFFFYPLLVAAKDSLYAWDLLTPPRYVGLDNYRSLLEDGSLYQSLKTTVGISVVVVAGALSLGLALALAANRPGLLAAWLRGSVFSAYVVSWVSVGLLWLWLLDADAGAVSRILRGLGWSQPGVLTHPNSAPVAIALVVVWKIAGYAMVVFLGGLQSIPKSVYEAAALDGASQFHRFRHVTLPLLAPSLAFVATTSLILSFQAFDVVRVMTQGGPVRSTTLFVYSVYERLFLDLQVGTASAEAVVFFFVLVLLTGLELWAFRKRERA